MDGRPDGDADRAQSAPTSGEPTPFEMRFAADDSAPRQARQALASWLDDRGVPPALRDDVTVVLSELVTNSVMHAASHALVRALLDPTWLRLEVHDDSHQPPTPRQPGGAGPGGYGLRIVSSLSADWGWTATADGKYVWTVHDRLGVQSE